MKNAIWKEIPLVYKGLKAKTAVSLLESGIAFEPRGSDAHKMFMGIANGASAEEQKRQFEKLGEWQKLKMVQIYRASARRRKKADAFGRRLRELREKALEEEKSAGVQKLPILAIGITERCNRGCLHCAVSADMTLGQMPFKDLEHYLSLVSIRRHLTITYGEPFLYNDGGKDLGDVVKTIFEMFPHVYLYIMTSGIRTHAEMEAAEKLAKLCDFDKARIGISISTRSFMDSMEPAGKTLKFFIENGIRAVPRLEGISLIHRKDGEWRKNIQNRGAMLADLLSGFGIRREDAMKFPSDIHYRGGIWCIGNAVKNHKEIIERMNKYFSGKKADDEAYFVMTPWYSFKDCNSEEFGLMPDGTVIPGCCHFVSHFLKLGTLGSADRDNISEVTKQMKEDARDMLVATKGRTCESCVDWFRRKGTESRIGIRDAERLMRIMPKASDISKLKKGPKIPARVL
jgi:hypothetical protein